MADQSIKRNFAYNSIYQISNIIIPLITVPYLSRTLLAEGVGEFSYAYSVAYYFYMFIRLGLHNYGNREIAYVKNDEMLLSKTFLEIYAFQFFMGLLISVLYIIYIVFISTNKLISILFLPFVISGGVDLTWVLSGLEEFKAITIRDVTVKIASTIFVFVFVKDKNDVWKYALIYSMGFFLSQVMVAPIIFHKISLIKPKLQNIASHIKPNLALFLPTIAVSIYKFMDRIMLGFMSGEEELGYYHSSENIIMVPLAISTALGTVMMPRVSNMLSRGERDAVERMLDKSIIFVMFASTSVSMGIMSVSKEFVPIFFGSGFDKCILIFKIILPSCIFLAFANVIRTQILIPQKKDGIYTISLLIGAVMNLGLNLLLIPRMAAVGASIGTLVTEITVCVIQAVSVLKEGNIIKNSIRSLPFIFAGCLMYLVFENYKITITDNLVVALLLKIVLSGSFYCIVLGVFLVMWWLFGKSIYRVKSKNNHL
ncbi:MAG: flippase [Butyrivibrio sp.]|nr:flippase [Butyrivibrio sp.]